MANVRTDTKAVLGVVGRRYRVFQNREAFDFMDGLVPELLFANAQPKHVGSIDVDIALAHRTIDADVYRTIREHLSRHSYEEGPQPFIFFRTVTVGSQSVNVQVDFLAGDNHADGQS